MHVRARGFQIAVAAAHRSIATLCIVTVMAELESGRLEASDISLLLESNEQEVRTPAASVAATEQQAQTSVSKSRL